MKEIQQNILVLGSTIAKLIWLDQANSLADKGIQTIFFVKEKTGVSAENKSIQTFKMPSNMIVHWMRFYKLIKCFRPHHIEAYHDLYRWDYLLSYGFYVLAAKVFRIPIISFCMGGEILYWQKHYFLKKWSIKFLLRSSSLIIVKEPYHKKYIETYRMTGSRKIPIIELPNAVDIQAEPEIKREGDLLLYLNSFKSWRNPEVVINAFKLVRTKHREARLIMAGYRTQEELAAVKAEINPDIRDSVQFIPYDLENRRLFSLAKIFILPAELIYVNNSLLEAMERGVPAVIGNHDPHGAKIIQNGKNGYRVDIDPRAVADAIIRLLENEELRQKMGRNARQTVMDRFNNNDRIEKLISIYNSLEG